MVKIKLNNEEFQIISFTKTTYLSASAATDNGNCELINPDVEKLKQLAETPVTSLQIYSDDKLIYELQDTNIQLDYINELLVDDHITTTLIMVFL